MPPVTSDKRPLLAGTAQVCPDKGLLQTTAPRHTRRLSISVSRATRAAAAHIGRRAFEPTDRGRRNAGRPDCDDHGARGCAVERIRPGCTRGGYDDVGIEEPRRTFGHLLRDPFRHDGTGRHAQDFLFDLTLVRHDPATEPIHRARD